MLRQAKVAGLGIAIILSLSSAALARNSKPYGYDRGYQDGYQSGRNARDQGYTYDYHTENYRYADRGYDRSMGEHDDFQNGYRNGFKAGYDAGFNGRSGRRNDSQGNNGYNPRYDPYGRNNAYNPGYGPFLRNNGYDPYARNDNDADDVYQNRDYGSYSRNGYGNDASDMGYRDGVAIGQKDRWKGKDFRPQKNDNYEDANHGYRKEYGDKNFFKQQYRRAFVRGYEDGYGRSHF
jgi:hypothetical protein